MISRNRILASIALLFMFFTLGRAIAQQPYHIIDRWKVGGDGGWDYLLADPPAHKLYITRGARVDVVDTQSGKLLGSISGLHGTHGIALDPDGKTGYISDGGGNAVVVFDRNTYATLATIPVGTNPDAIIYEPATKTVWAFNGRSKNASVVDATSRKVVATIALPGKPEFAAVDGTGLLYDNSEDTNQIVRLDAHTNTLTATWNLKGCDSPSGLAIDQAGSRLFAVCDAKVMAVVDAKTGAMINTPAICDGPDAAGWDPTHKLAFASCGDGNLAVVDASNSAYKTIQTLPTQKSARTMAYDATADRVYVVAAEFGTRPDATPDNPRPRAPMVPGTFTVIVIGR